MFMTVFVRAYYGNKETLCDSRCGGKAEAFPEMPKDLWGVWMWNMSLGLLNRKLWLWWPLSTLQIYECGISKIALKISPKTFCLPFVSFIINWKDSPLDGIFFCSAMLPFLPGFHLNPAALTDAGATSCIASFKYSVTLLPICSSF